MRKRNLGSMRHKLSIKAITRTPDGGGGYTRADTVTKPTIMGSVKKMSANELRVYDNLQERVTHKVIIRYRADAVHGATIVCHSHAGEVDLYIELSNDPRPERPGEWLELICREGGNL